MKGLKLLLQLNQPVADKRLKSKPLFVWTQLIFNMKLKSLTAAYY